MAEAQKPKDTVKQRKKSESENVQRYIPIAEIRNNTVILKSGGMRSVIKVEAINFNLKSETEQQGIIAGYGGLVNTLTFPIQVMIRSKRTNIDDYLNSLRSIAGTQTNALLQQQTLSYVSFIEKLLDLANIMQKEFYIVVPLDRNPRKKTMFEKFFEWLNPDDSSVAATQRRKDFSEGNKQLTERTELVQSGLANIGLRSNRLTTEELIKLYYNVLNPKTSNEQRLPNDVSQLQTDNLSL